jgi:hypothetical protein
MKEPVVVAPKFWSFLWHIFSQASKNVTVKVRVDHSVRRNKFMVNNPLHMKNKTMSMLFVELPTFCTFFAIGSTLRVSVADLQRFTQNLMQTHCSILPSFPSQTK